MQKVLVIDDSPLIHSLLGVRLKDEPVQLHSALDGEAGLTAAVDIAPDLILLDVDMPGLDGFEVCRRLKASKFTVDIPVIFLTGASQTEEKIKGLDLGAIDYITKPFDVAELKARVRASLRTRYLLELLAKKAMIDGLTGLWNRSYFDHRLNQEISLARRISRPLGVVMVDIDHFKKINDSYGHPGGDEVLRTVAQMLVYNCRVEDVVCRYGGEEFGIIAPNTRCDQCGELAERLRAVIGNTDIKCRGTAIRVTMSFGVADLVGAAGATMVELADAALYRAKAAGRDRVEIHRPSVAA